MQIQLFRHDVHDILAWQEPYEKGVEWICQERPSDPWRIGSCALCKFLFVDFFPSPSIYLHDLSPTLGPKYSWFQGPQKNDDIDAHADTRRKTTRIPAHISTSLFKERDDLFLAKKKKFVPETRDLS